ncbi:phytoene desaturase family protein [Cytophagales bacterium LB-30]|uniref:Phytoene desaturase family protein n=1 Tax=Shiella aurantiaca TaxID=3058365 RepID=A0ABT8F690_9BACT|nr:1-hydroxycarotenoid 3,4-desaturase CrtD [Shiella aurantiaca]MDN4165794.1 phytoene desaturase family protein [Shiella aurantiaca]
MPKKAIVIGAGVAGLASAIRLAQKGFKVEILEANSYPGGKLHSFTQEGYRFDAGPSLFTMPHFVEELFTLCQKPVEAYFQYSKMEEACRYFYEDGTRLIVHADTEKFAQEVESQLGVPSERVLKYLAHSRQIYETSGKIFLEKSLHKADTWLSTEVLKALLLIPSFDLHRSMHGANSSRLKHPKLIQLFDRFATYNGSSPYQAPGILNVIPHLEHGFGTFFPKGGMHAITRALVQLAEEMGVKIRYQQRVEKILVENGKAIGVELNGEKRFTDVVISNMDVVPTYRKLLPTEKAPERTLRQERSSSALIFYWGIQKELPELGLHNIFFSENYKEEFRQIFEEKTVYADPTVYIHISSKVEKEDAPAGCENWFVMVNVPGNTGQDWSQITQAVREAVLLKLSRILGQDIASLIANESILDPIRIEENTASYQGSLYGAASNNAFAAFLRHPNFSSSIQNLHFCGGSVHPGGGIPLCLLSAKIMVDTLTV